MADYAPPTIKRFLLGFACGGPRSADGRDRDRRKGRGIVRDRVSREVKEAAEQLGRPPGLATVLVGENPASAIYVRRKREACEEVGIRSFITSPMTRSRRRSFST